MKAICIVLCGTVTVTIHPHLSLPLLDIVFFRKQQNHLYSTSINRSVGQFLCRVGLYGEVRLETERPFYASDASRLAHLCAVAYAAAHFVVGV
jgi:hypothetical protein